MATPTRARLPLPHRKNWAISSRSKTGEGFDLALLPFEGAKNKGAWGMTHRSEVAIVPRERSEETNRKLRIKRMAGGKEEEEDSDGGCYKPDDKDEKNKQSVKREVKQFYEEDLEAQSKLADAAFEELVQQQKQKYNAKNVLCRTWVIKANKKKNNNKNNKNAQKKEEEEEDTKGALAQRGNQQHLVPLNKMELFDMVVKITRGASR